MRMNALQAKFRGCLVGALVGDALGSVFEATSSCAIPMKIITDSNSAKKLKNYSPDKPLEYTDDTAMTKAICRSLLDKRGFDQRDMAKKFTDEYFNQEWRGYGSGVVTVFRTLHDQKHDDVTLPSRKQFNGSGSYGNGAAMRVSPVALFAKDFATLQQVACDSALITHSHLDGINGAILQAAAVQKALEYNPPDIDKEEFLEYLNTIAERLENESNKESSRKGDGKDHETVKSQPYVNQFKKIKELHSQGDKINAQDVVEALGNGISALQAVPAAIFSFIFTSDKSFEESINFAMSLGGDTDTIASMCGAISGAYWGIEAFPAHWLCAVESVNEMKEFADQILKMRDETGEGTETD